MNDLRKAAEMALEALEWNYGTDLENIENCMVWLDKMNATIPALRQALAHPDLAKVGEVGVRGEKEANRSQTTTSVFISNGVEE